MDKTLQHLEEYNRKIRNDPSKVSDKVETISFDNVLKELNLVDQLGGKISKLVTRSISIINTLEQVTSRLDALNVSE